MRGSRSLSEVRARSIITITSTDECHDLERKDMLNKPEGGEDFDVAVEDAIADRPAKRAKGQGGPKLGRTARDKKYGFGGSKKHAKQNTRASTDNFSPGAGKGKGGRKPGMGKRPGKSKRMAARSKR